MTKSENNATQSENSTLTLQDPEIHSLQVGALTYFTVLRGIQNASFVSPIDCYLNLFAVESSSYCTVQAQDHRYGINKGENILIQLSRGAQFTIESYESDTRLILVLFHCNGLPSFQVGTPRLSDNRTSLMIKQILDLYAEKSCFHQLKIQTLLLDVIVNHVEGSSTENRIGNLSRSKNYFELVQLAKHLIDDDPSKNHTLSDLAKTIGTNTQYLKKYFKQQYGKTVMNYITEVKMEHAKKLILQNQYRITDIARMLGYKHSTHFSTAFKKYFGVVPNSLKYALFLGTKWSVGGFEMISTLSLI